MMFNLNERLTASPFKEIDVCMNIRKEVFFVFNRLYWLYRQCHTQLPRNLARWYSWPSLQVAKGITNTDNPQVTTMFGSDRQAISQNGR